MHEMSICLALLDEVTRVAGAADAKAVCSVTLRVGPLSGVEAGLLARAFEVACCGTVAEDATLVVEIGRVRVRCSVCAGENDAMPNQLLCSRCGDYRTRVIEGDELVLSTMEMELPDDEAAAADDASAFQASSWAD